MDINEAMEKINFIKETIEDTKIHYKGIYLMCFLLGGLYMIQFIMVMTEVTFFGFSFGSYRYVFYCGVEAIALLCYFLICKNEKKYSNKYYLSLLSIWGFISIVVPIIVNVVELIGKIFFTESYEMNSMSTTYVVLGFSKILLFSIFMIICSYILNHNYFRVLSIIILFGYFFIHICFFGKGLPFPFVPGQKQMGIGYVTIYTVLIVDFGYLIMGLYLKYKEGLEQKK